MPQLHHAWDEAMRGGKEAAAAAAPATCSAGHSLSAVVCPGAPEQVIRLRAIFMRLQRGTQADKDVNPFVTYEAYPDFLTFWLLHSSTYSPSMRQVKASPYPLGGGE
ncbi:hypothetical protein JRQ81_004200, partial [Phrynocephalus forsythii]